MQHNEARAEIHNHVQPPALVVGGLLAAFGICCLTLVYVQGTIYTREAQLTRERAEYQQAQIVELRTKLDRAEARMVLAESRIQSLREQRNGRD